MVSLELYVINITHMAAIGGAAFIKWSQWASTRPVSSIIVLIFFLNSHFEFSLLLFEDLIPETLCHYLAALQTNAPAHSFAFTRQEIERTFGASIESIFSRFDPIPVASG